MVTHTYIFLSHCQTSQSHLLAARGSLQKFANDYDVIFMCYYNINYHGINVTCNMFIYFSFLFTVFLFAGRKKRDSP